jgi:hypothetical protein
VSTGNQDDIAEEPQADAERASLERRNPGLTFAYGCVCERKRGAERVVDGPADRGGMPFGEATRNEWSDPAHDRNDRLGFFVAILGGATAFEYRVERVLSDVHSERPGKTGNDCGGQTFCHLS